VPKARRRRSAGERHAGRRSRGERSGDAGNDLKRNPSLAHRLQFLGEPSEHSRIAPFESHNHASLGRECGEQMPGGFPWVSVRRTGVAGMRPRHRNPFDASVNQVEEL